MLPDAYCIGIPSTRRIDCSSGRVPSCVLTGDQQQSHSRISVFYLVHLDTLAGLVSLGNVDLDGIKVRANGFRHKSMGHQRMLKTEAEMIFAQEDTRYGQGKRGDVFPGI